MIPSFFCNWVSNSIDRLFVGRLAGMATNALYGAATQLGNILQIAFLPVFMTYMPIFYRLSGAGAEERDVALACNRLIMLLIGVAGCLLIAVAPLLAGTVLPASYIGVSGTFAWLIVAGCFAQAAGIATIGLYHCRRTDLVFYISALQAVVAIVADIALIPSMGRQGAVLAQLLSNVAATTGLFILAWRVYGDVLKRAFLVRNLTAIVIMGFLAEIQSRVAAPVILLVPETMVLVFFCGQIWAERQTARDILSKNLWQTPEPAGQAA